MPFLQPRLILIVHACRGKSGFGTLAGCYGHLQGSTIGHLVDHEQRLPLPDRFALVGQDASDATRHLRTYLHNLTSRESCTVLAFERHVLATYHHCLM